MHEKDDDKFDHYKFLCGPHLALWEKELLEDVNAMDAEGNPINIGKELVVPDDAMVSSSEAAGKVEEIPIAAAEPSMQRNSGIYKKKGKTFYFTIIYVLSNYYKRNPCRD